MGLLGGIVGGLFSRNEAKREANMAAQDRDLQLQMHRDTLARTDKSVLEGKEDYAKQLAQIEELHRSTQAQLESAYASEDSAAVQRLQDQLSAIESNGKELMGAISSGEQYGNQILANDDKNLNDLEQSTANRKLGARGELENTNNAIGNNARIINDERDRLVSAGSRPEGLDAAQSEIYGNFRDAEANIRRQNGGQISEAEKLNLEMNKAKALGGTSADMRQDWSRYRTGAIGNLAQQSNAGAQAIYGNSAALRNEEASNDQYLYGNKAGNNANKINLGQSFLDKKLGAISDRNNTALASKDLYNNFSIDKQADRANSFIGNNANRLSAQDAALGNLSMIKQSAMGTTAASNGQMAGIFGNSSLAARSRASGFRANAVNSFAGGIGKVEDAALGAYVGNKWPTK